MARKKKTSKTDGKAIIVCRVSTTEQADNYSLSSQEKTCRSFCKGKSIQVDKVFTIEGETARDLRRRPEFLKIMSYAQRNREKLKYFVVYSASRFSRNVQDTLVLRARLSAMGISLLSVTENLEDDTAAGKFMANVLYAQSEFESNLISERTTAGMREAQNGGVFVNKAPFGYDNVHRTVNPGRLCINSEKARYIRIAFEMYDRGQTSRAEIARYLNTIGFESVAGKKATHQKIDYFLKNRTYSSRSRLKDNLDHVRGLWEPIIDIDLFERVQARLLRESNSVPVNYKRDREEFPLRRFIRCSSCGSHLTGYSAKKMYPYYNCYNKKCNEKHIKKEQLESDFVELLSGLVPSKEFENFFIMHTRRMFDTKAKEAASKRRELNRFIDNLVLKKQRLIDKHIEDKIQPEVYTDQYGIIVDSISNAKNELASVNDIEDSIDRILNAVVYKLQNAANLWLNSSLKARRAFQKALFPNGLEYHPEEKFRTPPTPLYFNYLDVLETSNEGMATPTGIEPVLPA